MSKNHFTRGGLSALCSLAVVLAVVSAPVGCAKVEPAAGRGGTGGAGGRGSVSGIGGRTSVPWVAECTQCMDFKVPPIVDPSAPANAADSFVGNPPATGGPCITEPEDNTLFPNNWLRPRIKFSGANGQLVRITLSANNQTDVLTAYTTKDRWEVPKAVWNSLRSHQVNDPVTVTVWVKGGGASQTKFRTAPVGAGGNLIFWAAKPTEVDKNLEVDCMKGANNQPLPSCYENDSELRFFSVGDETTVRALTIPQVTQRSKDNNNKTSPVRCIGCHTGTPDGDYVAFNDAWPWRGVMAGVTQQNAGMPPPYLTQGGVDDLQQPALGVMTFSQRYWSAMERIVITSNSWTPMVRNQWAWYDAPHNPRPELVWFDLTSPPVPRMGANIQGDPANPDLVFPIVGVNMGVIARTSDPRGAATPNWSHDGNLIAYSSTDSAVDGHLDNIPTPSPNPFNWSHNMGHSDVWVVPYANKAGGMARAVRGADTTMFEEYFPSFSPDDKLIAFNRVPVSESMYANPKSEIAVVVTTPPDPNVTPVATVLAANRPPACTGKVSPGVNNHWVKWAPTYAAGSEGTYYWVVFSSNRADIPPVASKWGAKRQIQVSQLYIAPIVIGEGGVRPYPAIYLWNQPEDTVNTTPAWETFQLPPIE